MKKWKAFVTRGFPGEEAMNRLKEEFDVVQKSGWFAPTREEYLQNLKDADVMLCYSDDIDEALVEQAPNLKFVVDNWGIDGEKKKMFERHHVKVFEGMPNSYPWIVKGVAEIAWGLILATGRRFREGDELVRHGTWTHSEQSNHELLGEGLVGRKLGILGAGRIGMEVARRAAGFETEVLYTDVNDNAEMNAMGCKRVEKQTLFAESDFNAFGTLYIAANNIVVKVDHFCVMPIMSFSAALNTFVGQNVGAKRMDRVRRGARDGLLIGSGISLVSTAIMLLFGRYCMLLFTDDQSAIATAMTMLSIIAPFWIGMAAQQNVASILRGMGESVLPMAVSVLGLFLFRIPSAYLLYAATGNPFTCWWGMAMNWALCGLILLVYYVSGRWRQNRRIIRAMGDLFGQR